MSAQRRVEPNSRQGDTPSIHEGAVETHASPARDLQARLHAHFELDVAPVWTRYVTLFLVISFAGTWMLGNGGYTDLPSV